MGLTSSNYFSREAEQMYCGSTQYKDFCGCLGRLGCEERALNRISGKWHEEPSKDMLIGSYVDAAYDGTLEEFKESHPELFVSKGSRIGELKAEFIKAQNIFERCESDPLFHEFMSGIHQPIFTGEIEGLKFKIKIDSLHPGKCIVDLKVVQYLHKAFWAKDYGYMNFIEYWGYTTQLAIYQEIYRQATGDKLPCYIAAVDKGDFPDIGIMYVDDGHLSESLEEVKHNCEKISMLKSGEIKPLRCELCDYCKSTRVLEKPIHYSELLGDI